MRKPAGRYERQAGSLNMWTCSCAYNGCTNHANLGPTGKQGAMVLPTQLRLLGWAMTGKTNSARWWCPKHVAAVNAK